MSPDARDYERVYTLHDYFDGPRLGVAGFEGQPHVYQAIQRGSLGGAPR